LDIAVRSRNLEVPTTLRQSVERKVGKLARFIGGMDRAEVVFFEERNPRLARRDVCEVTVHGHGHTVRARATGADPLSAVDRVIDKLEAQMVKLKGKLVGRSHPRRAAAPPDGSRPPAAGTPPAPARGPQPAPARTPQTAPSRRRIVSTEPASTKPMTPEEAVLQMELAGQGFYLFTNSETGRAAVVYAREDGDIGLIDAPG